METVGISLKVPKDFSLKLARHILRLSERGIKTNKSDLIIKLAEIGFKEETKNNTSNES